MSLLKANHLWLNPIQIGPFQGCQKLRELRGSKKFMLISKKVETSKEGLKTFEKY